MVVYVYISLRIYYLERANKEHHGENDIGLAVPTKFKTDSHSQVTDTVSYGCASTLLYYYSSASLLWSLVIFWKKKHQRFAMNIIFILLVIINIIHQFSSGYCETLEKLEKGAAIIAWRIDRSSWSDAYSPKEPMNGNIRISFRLHDPDYNPYPDKFAGVVGYRCRDRADLPPPLSKRTVLNFTTTVATDLKILFIGDSIAEQFAQAFDAMVLGNGFEMNRLARTYRNGHNNINVHNCLSISAPTRGGGVSAFWRIATLMSWSTRRPIFKCEHKWETWNEQQAFFLTGHQYFERGNKVSHHHVQSGNNPSIASHGITPYSVGSYDAIVLRVPHGWLKIGDITKERILEAITLSTEYVGAKTVIISTLPLNRFVKTLSDWEGISKINQMIRDIARSQPQPLILVQEFGNFTNQLLRINAEYLQMTDKASPEFSQDGWELNNAGYILKRLSSETYWLPPVCMVCANKTYPVVNEKNQTVDECLRNKISRDGLHWCVESLGPRYAASVACLLGCVYNGDNPSSTSHDANYVRKCEQKCNDQFMSVQPVDDEWILSQKSLFSKSF